MVVQVEARLQDRDSMLASLQQSGEAMQQQQAQDRKDLIAANAHRGQLEGQLTTLTRWHHGPPPPPPPPPTLPHFPLITLGCSKSTFSKTTWT